MSQVWELHEMDCRMAMAMMMPPDSVDSIVTDPPYGLSKEPKMEDVLRHWLNGDDYVHGGAGFMLKDWDSFVPGPSVWREAYRVLKPGGHLVAFFGTRTYDLGVLALRLAGFEIRDQLAWVFGSGFPKSHDVSKGIDKAADYRLQAEVRRAAVVAVESAGLQLPGNSRHDWTAGEHAPGDKWWARFQLWLPGLTDSERNRIEGDILETVRKSAGWFTQKDIYERRSPATGAARQWRGWGTALKPAYEPIVLARKPLVGTVARNVLSHGTGALNIDGCRVEHNEECRMMAPSQANIDNPSEKHRQAGRRTQVLELKPGGRWPANLAHDGSPEVLAGFPVTSSGKMKAGTVRAAQDEPGSVCYGTFGGRATDTDTPGDSGSAARFFKSCPINDEDAEAARLYYCAKASKSDRNEGLDDLPEQPRAASEFRPNHTEGAAAGEPGNPYGRWSPVRNTHPTVKPTALMQWLVRLVTPPGGLVLDPFTGSGSTGKAAMLEGFSFVGCEMDPDYAKIARLRIDHAVNSR